MLLPWLAKSMYKFTFCHIALSMSAQLMNTGLHVSTLPATLQDSFAEPLATNQELHE
jgi:hypothetical protein